MPSAMKGGRGHAKRASVSFQEPDELVEGERGRAKSPIGDLKLSHEELENKRKERRRNEAKASIEVRLLT